MTELAEYSEVNDTNRARHTILREAFSTKVKTDVRLVAVTEGWEPAGSVARWTDGYFAVQFNRLGGIHGARYQSMLDATAHYLRLTKAETAR
jgi:hypothetical protein